MKKLFKSFFALAAVALMASCSNDEPAPAPNGVIPEGATAVMKVNIRAAQSAYGRDDNYTDGSATEHDIKNAKFYFFDANKRFVLEATVWNGGTENPGDHNNIEYMGNNVLVLKGLETNTTPNYMLTVLNVPNGFSIPQGTSLNDVRNMLLNIRNTCGSTEDCFTMSTSSIVDNDGDNAAYGVNILDSTNFGIQKPGESIDMSTEKLKPVAVYVERLAAKIDVSIDDRIAKKTIGGKNYYELKVSVAGEENEEGLANEGLTQLYVELTNWGINATPAQSYLTKNISGFTATAAPFENWNAPNDFRSFWAKSVGYGEETPALNYINYDQVTNAFGAAAYCPEYTNTVANITADVAHKVLKPDMVTSVIFKARIVDIDNDNNVTTNIDFVRFNGVLYTESSFINYVASYLNTKGQLNYWKLTSTEEVDNGDGTTTIVRHFDQLTPAELGITLEATGAGTGKVRATTSMDPEAPTGSYYTKSGTTFSETATDWDAAAINTLKANLKKFYNDNETTSVANSYKGGWMFYSIPVKHLVALADDGVIVEGNYGVVRNHWYQLNITSVGTIGHGVFNPGDGSEENPGETIIPDDPEDETYYLGATINILSWKVITQNVPL